MPPKVVEDVVMEDRCDHCSAQPLGYADALVLSVKSLEKSTLIQKNKRVDFWQRDIFIRCPI